MPRKLARLKLQTGFTLIESLVVISISVMLMLTASVLFMTFMIGSAKTNLEQQIKSEGDYALKQIEFILRNANGLADGEDCATAGPDSIAVRNFDGDTTTLQSIADEGVDKIASTSTLTSKNYFLTSDDLTLTNLSFNCTEGAGDTQYVTVSFTLTAGAGETAEIATLDFSTGVTLRN